MQIYHNPRCAKSREALRWLENNGIEAQVILYLKDMPSKVAFKRVLKKLELKASDLIRTTDKLYKDSYKGKSITEKDWFDILMSHPSLIQRPIVINGDRAVIARPADKIKELL